MVYFGPFLSENQFNLDIGPSRGKAFRERPARCPAYSDHMRSRLA